MSVVILALVLLGLGCYLSYTVSFTHKEKKFSK